MRRRSERLIGDSAIKLSTEQELPTFVVGINFFVYLRQLLNLNFLELVIVKS